MIYKTLLLTAFLCISSLFGESGVTPTFVARSQSSDASRKLVGVVDKVHLMDAGFYANFSAMPEYTKSMNGKKIAQALFGCDLVGDCNKILVQGSSVANRNEKAWLADYFYLAPDYDSYFTVDPVIQNFLVDLDLYIGLDQVVEGMYARFYGPVTYTEWKLNFSQPACGDVVTTGSYSPGYFNATPSTPGDDDGSFTGMPNNQLLRNAGEFFAGKSPLNQPSINQDPSLGVEFVGLDSALLESCGRSNTGFAELRGELGWNFYQTEKSHIGINFQIAAPTGSKRVATFAFDSVVGNGNHWELGGGVTAHYEFWRSQTEDKHAGIYLDANITHLNKAKEERTFDLCGKNNSRYMLAMKMGRPTTFADYDSNPTLPVGNPNPTLLTVSPDAASAATLPNGAGVNPQATFAGVFMPVANLTTMNVNVSVGVQADIAAMFNYTSNAWSLDLGYNLYARSAEKISLRDTSAKQCCPNLCADYNVWALKGDARVYGFMAADGSGSPVISGASPIPLSATQSDATIHGGTNATATYNATTCPGTPAYQNCGVDNAQFAYGAGQALVSEPGLAYATSTQVKTSYQPVFINCCDINFQETTGISNKVFGHLSYTWGQSQYKPYLGVGGFGEFGMNKTGCCEAEVDECAEEAVYPCDASDCCDVKCSSSLRSTLSQWGIWVKGGIEFN